MSVHLIHKSTHHYWHFDENQQCHQLPAMANLSQKCNSPQEGYQISFLASHSSGLSNSLHVTGYL
jgi:hypothetical protein